GDLHAHRMHDRPLGRRLRLPVPRLVVRRDGRGDERPRAQAAAALHGRALGRARRRLRERRREVIMRRAALLVIAALLAAGCPHAGGGGGAAPAAPPGEVPAFPFPAHLSQEQISSGAVRFADAFLFGDALFSAAFNSLDGAGALRLPDGTTLTSRFSRVP